VGSREQVADLIVRLVRGGIRHFILDVPHHEREFAEFAAACQTAAKTLDSRAKAKVESATI
jgi:alkanesulfonate monooxygenase SsuD/methylene tetrahydromethanopterin reductase-like flavin-dependent oxidoreductase (luciferase family)